MKRHYNNMDWMRLGLALSVVFMHSWNATGDKIKGLYPAVPAFLALSGFLVLQSYENSSGAYHFFWKRFLRVGPAFFASFVLVAALYGWASVGPTFHTWYTVGLVPDHGSRNGVLWTLTVEEVLYATLAIAYACGVYKRPGLLWVGLLAALVLPVIVWGETAVRARGVAALPGAFIIGNLFYLYRNRLKESYWPILAVAGSLALFAIRGESFASQYAVQMIFVAALIWCAAAGPQIKHRVKLDVSYGTYLYHLLILGTVVQFAKDRGSIMLLTFAGALAVSLVSAYAIERPALRWKNRPPRFSWRRRQPKVETIEVTT